LGVGTKQGQYHERTYYYFQATNPEVTEQGDEKIDLTAHNSFSKQKELLRARTVHPSKLGLLTETKKSNQARAGGSPLRASPVPAERARSRRAAALDERRLWWTRGLA